MADASRQIREIHLSSRIDDGRATSFHFAPDSVRTPNPLIRLPSRLEHLHPIRI